MTTIVNKKTTDDFPSIWERIKAKTPILSFTQLAEAVNSSKQGVSRKKRENDFPLEWAYKVARHYGLLTEWIMTGEGPARAGEASTEANNTAQQVDAELLAEIIAGVMDFLTEDNREMVPDKMAELIAALYEMYSCSGKNVDKQNIIRLIKAAA